MSEFWIFLGGVYFGGALGTFSRVLGDHATMTPEERERFREIGRPVVSLIVQTVLWPLFTLLTILWKVTE